MKKFFALAAATLMLASCSNDDFDGQVLGGEATVSVTATLPSNIHSRVYSDGTTATDFYYAVYEATSTGDACIIEKTQGTSFTDRTTTLSLKLVTGKTYKMVFWAQSPNATKLFDVASDLSTIKVNYDEIEKLNVEDTDAFWCMKEVYVEKSSTVTAELKRPFAQINVGTSDLGVAALAGKEISTAMTVNGVYTQYNLLTGDVLDATTTEVTFAKTLRPNHGKAVGADGYEKFPVGNVGQYEYLAMAYVLMSKDKQTADIDLDFYDGTTRFHHLDVDAAPLQRNYRTNIFGALLTSEIDFTINILPGYDGSYNEIQDVEPLTPDPVTGVYSVGSALDLLALGATFTSDITVGQNYTVEITQDIDMSGYTYTPPFAYYVTINGNGHTIKNLNITQNENGRAGFVAYLGGGQVNDLVLENVSVEGREAGIIAGQAEGGKVNNVTIKGDCSVSFLDEVPSSWYDAEWDGIGAIFGLNAENTSGSITIDSDCTIKLYHNGLSNNTTAVNDCDEYTYYLKGKKNNPTITNNGSIVAVWDGQPVAAVAVDGAYQAVCPGNWAWLAAKYNSASSALDKGINLACDLDFNGGTVAPMFAGSSRLVEGNNHTMSNFTIANSGKAGSGLFVYYGFQIQNVTIQNVACTQDLTGGFSDQWMGVLGGILEDGNCNATINNVTIDGASLNGCQSVGGFVGRVMGSSTVTMNNCTIKNSTVRNQFWTKESGFVAAFVGCAIGKVKGDNNTAENVTVDGVWCDKRGEQSIQQLVGYYSTTDPTTVNLLTNSTWGADCTLTVTYGGV